MATAQRLLVLLMACMFLCRSTAKSPLLSVTSSDLALIQRRTATGRKQQAGAQVSPAAASISSGDIVYFRTPNGDYLQAAENKAWVGEVDAARDAQWQEIAIEKESNFSATVRSGDIVFLRTCTGRHLVMSESEDVSPGSWDDRTARQKERRFVIERQAGDGAVLEGDTIFFVPHNGLAFVLEGEYLRARRPGANNLLGFVVERADKVPLLLPSWVVRPREGAHCDPSLACHRRLDISCRFANMTEAFLADCNHEQRPWSYEPCFKSPHGACIDIAYSDCLDIPGGWWNDDNATCPELKDRGACGDEVVQRACRASCGDCEPAKTTPPPTTGCHDEQLYRSTFNWNCAWFKSRNCSEYAFHAELKKACPKSCGLC
eukprot:TRINITY_DN106869_c0_g1_i1.p1 TRINITY_DN106869_c0_g1~~TRINITY_DN106869_c0_g1_i1.p1  ORF type:complete len:375 (-),score=60.81 TRINITY_DN106869_c0_g1_i1:67-1191(-)